MWIFRTLAFLGVPALIVLGLEMGLRLSGYGHPPHFLIPDESPGFFRTNPDFLSLFMPESFDLPPLNYRVAARKPANTIRIVILGESAAEGIPAPAFGFAPQLRAQLRDRYPDKNIEVINTGIVAINSHVVYQIARDLAGFSPDLFVVYLGNNEVVGPYAPGCTYLSETPPLWIIRLSVFVRSTRTGQLLKAVMRRFARRGAPPPEWGGMEMFADQAVAGDDPRLEAVYHHFETNLGDIVRTAAGAGAKTLLCTMVSNLKDCAPLLSRHRTGLTGDELAAWQTAFARGRLEWRLGESAAARKDLEEALRLDPHYADTSFMLGRLALEAGDIATARAHLIDAEHWDALRFRPDPRINEIIRRVAGRERGASLVDAAISMGSDPASSAPPPGRELLFEHVHFDWEGNYRLARAMAEGTETILFGHASTQPWLDSGGCAAALAYSAHERFSVLEHLAPFVQTPPFTNQLTYPEDMARLAQELARAKAVSTAPETLRQAKAVVDGAIARDPENPTLAKLEEDVDDDLGDVAGALAAARRTQQFQPGNFALATDEAIKLSRLGRLDESLALLKKTAATCALRDRAAMAPAFIDYYLRTKQFDAARRYLDELITQRPSDHNLQLLRARLARQIGDSDAAEREYRAILADEPGNQNAQEALVEFLSAHGKTAAAEEASLAAADRQPRNQRNNLRAAVIEESRGHDSTAIKYLLAAEHSGPVTSGIELRLARKFLALHQPDEALTHLAIAKQISRYEGDTATTDSITEVIANLRAETR